MIGSKRKRDAIYKSLIIEGFTIDDLKRVYSPIGINIHSETHQEVAVSIIAELIAVRRG
jgi:xanthine dehydrogenase accessory factor